VGAIGRTLASVGVNDPTIARALIDGGLAYGERLALERRARRMLERLDRPTFELPLLDSGVDASGVHELALELRLQGAA
jgi:hypothetical protein